MTRSKESFGNGSDFGVRAGQPELSPIRLAQHPQGWVRDNHFPGVLTDGIRNAARPATGIQHAAGSWQGSLFEHRLQR